MQTILKIENLCKYYGKKNNVVKAVDGISFDVQKGEMLAIMGASGSGKTSLLNCISTIDKHTSGNIFIDGVNIANLSQGQLSKFRRDKLGFVFQDFNLLNTLKAFENIALSLSIKKVPSKQIKPQIMEVADILNISNKLNKYPYELSGGEKQRIAIARAIVSNPALILADEPTGSLDSNSAKALMESFVSLNQMFNATILIVSHDPNIASYCQRVVFIKDGKINREMYKDGLKHREFFNNILNAIGEDNAD